MLFSVARHGFEYRLHAARLLIYLAQLQQRFLAELLDEYARPALHYLLADADVGDGLRQALHRYPRPRRPFFRAGLGQALVALQDLIADARAALLVDEARPFRHLVLQPSHNDSSNNTRLWRDAVLR